MAEHWGADYEEARGELVIKEFKRAHSEDSIGKSMWKCCSQGMMKNPVCIMACSVLLVPLFALGMGCAMASAVALPGSVLTLIALPVSGFDLGATIAYLVFLGICTIGSVFALFWGYQENNDEHKEDRQEFGLQTLCGVVFFGFHAIGFTIVVLCSSTDDVNTALLYCTFGLLGGALFFYVMALTWFCKYFPTHALRQPFRHLLEAWCRCRCSRSVLRGCCRCLYDDYYFTREKCAMDAPSWLRHCTCEQGHQLFKFKTPIGGWACDYCYKNSKRRNPPTLRRGTVLYGCSLCKFDLCSSCIAAQCQEKQTLANDLEANTIGVKQAASDVEVVSCFKGSRYQPHNTKVVLPPRETANPAVTKIGGSVLTEVVDSSMLQTLQIALNTKPEWLGLGRDVAQEICLTNAVAEDCNEPGRTMASATYSKLVLVKAWHVSYEIQENRYKLAKQEVKEQLSRFHQNPPKISLKSSSCCVGLGLPVDSSINECIALHGTTPSALVSILSSGLNERCSVGGAFGDGTYLAEDAGKCDQYCEVDERRDESSLLHKSLYPSQDDHPGEICYILVCKVLLGWAAFTLDGITTKDGSGLWANPATKRELANIPVADCPLAYHGLVVEVGQAVKRYREVVSFRNDHMVTKYLIAYRRSSDGKRSA